MASSSTPRCYRHHNSQLPVLSQLWNRPHVHVPLQFLLVDMFRAQRAAFRLYCSVWVCWCYGQVAWGLGRWTGSSGACLPANTLINSLPHSTAADRKHFSLATSLPPGAEEKLPARSCNHTEEEVGSASWTGPYPVHCNLWSSLHWL